MSKRSPLLASVFTEKCREALSHMLSVTKEEQERGSDQAKDPLQGGLLFINWIISLFIIIN